MTTNSIPDIASKLETAILTSLGDAPSPELRDKVASSVQSLSAAVADAATDGAERRDFVDRVINPGIRDAVKTSGWANVGNWNVSQARVGSDFVTSVEDKVDGVWEVRSLTVFLHRRDDEMSPARLVTGQSRRDATLKSPKRSITHDVSLMRVAPGPDGLLWCSGSLTDIHDTMVVGNTAASLSATLTSLIRDELGDVDSAFYRGADAA